MLARSQSALGEHQKSVLAWREIIRLVGEPGPDELRGFASALIAARMGGEGDGVGSIDDETINTLTKLEAIDTDDPLVLFYLGLSDRDAGNLDSALGRWRTLRGRLPKDAPILKILDDLIAETDQSSSP